MQISHEPGRTRLVISIQRAWDVDLFLDDESANSLAVDIAEAHGPSRPATTADDQPATLTVTGHDLAISVPDESLDVSISLAAGHATSLAEALLDRPAEG